VVHFLVLSLSSFIIIKDLRSHRIPNIATLALGGVLFIDCHSAGALLTISVAAIVTTIFLLAKVGMGDVKLFLVLVFTQGSLVISIRYLQLVIFIMVITVLAAKAARGNISGSVAFAHVILLPFLALYLAI
jgi:Flp pilus assembly protein protease CpaA